MIYLFHGTDTEKVRAKAFEWIAKARAKEQNLAYVRLSREELSDATLDEIAFSGGLFVKRMLVLIDDPYQAMKAAEDEEEGEEQGTNVLDAHLDALAASDNAIVILAPKLASAKAKKLAAKAKIEYSYDKNLSRAPATRGFNSALVNALAARSGEKLWLEIERALAAGDAPEMIHGLLHWKARDIMEKGARAWSPEEARKLSLDLIALLQESRRGGLDLSLALERFALAV